MHELRSTRFLRAAARWHGHRHVARSFQRLADEIGCARNTARAACERFEKLCLLRKTGGLGGAHVKAWIVSHLAHALDAYVAPIAPLNWVVRFSPACGHALSFLINAGTLVEVEQAVVVARHPVLGCLRRAFLLFPRREALIALFESL
jgi:hypothetical protein